MKKLLFAVFITTLGLYSCKKESGEGGNSSIVGKVYGYDINTNGVITDSGFVGDARVYISYGENAWPDDDARTSYTGDFAFHNLKKGKYKLYVYSQCDDCPFNQTYVVQYAEITKNNEQITLPNFIITD